LFNRFGQYVDNRTINEVEEIDGEQSAQYIFSVTCGAIASFWAAASGAFALYPEAY
jgi:hypothetical protein